MVSNRSLENILKSKVIPDALEDVFESIRNEDSRYSADEIVAAGEELLAFISALALQIYIHSSNQRPDLNRIALDILRGTMGPNPNAGAYFWRGARLLSVCGDTDAGAALRDKIMDYDGEYYTAKEEFMELSRLRNRIMHGIFIQPPAKNHADTDNLCAIAERLFGDGFFKPEIVSGEPRLDDLLLRPLFTAENGRCLVAQNFTVLNRKGDYSSMLDDLKGRNLFREEISIILDEYGMKFSGGELPGEEEVPCKDPEKAEELSKKILSLGRGAILFEGGCSTGKSSLWAGVKRSLMNEPGIFLIAFRMKQRGLLYSADMVNRIIADIVMTETGEEQKKNESDLNYIKRVLQKKTLKIILLIDDIHQRYGAQDHMLHLYNEYYVCGITIAGFSAPYPVMLRCFNERVPLNRPLLQADDEVMEKMIQEYVSDTGPFKGQSRNEDNSYAALCATVKQLYALILKGEKIDLRGSVDENQSYSLLEEAAYILTPFCMHGSAPFEKDEADRITGFPLVITESTFPYQVMKRRDIAMEYRKHIIGGYNNGTTSTV